VQDDHIVARSAAISGALAPARTRTFTAQLADIAARVSPLRLGLVQALMAFILSTVMLSLPARQPGFQGVNNNANGPRAYRRLDMWIDDLGWIGAKMSGLGLSPNSFTWLLRGAHISLWLLQGIAIVALVVQFSRNGGIGPVWRWVTGPALTAGLLLLYPPLCADVFYYITSGWVASTGANPYSAPLRANFDAPLLALNDWGHIASPYGPIWTDITQTVVRIFGTGFLTAVLSFRLLSVASAVVFVILVYALTRRLTGDRTIAIGAAIAVSWMPTMLFETATGAHNDAIMFDLALGGLLMMTSHHRGTTRLGLLLIAASALLKYVTLPLLAFALLWRIADRKHGEPYRRIATQWALDGVAILALIVAAYGPYWDGPKMFDSILAQPTRGVSSPFWLLPHQLAQQLWGSSASKRFDDIVGYLTIGLLVPVFAVTFVWLWRRMWQMDGSRGESDCGATHDRRLLLQMQAWMIVTAYLSFFPVDTHNWYAIWSIAPMFIMLAWLTKRKLVQEKGESVDVIPNWIANIGPARLCTIFLIWSCFNMVLYHTRTL
jgi:hypothetical protein